MTSKKELTAGWVKRKEKYAIIQVEKEVHRAIKMFSEFTKIHQVHIVRNLAEFAGIIPPDTPSNIFENMVDPHFRNKFKLYCEIEKEKENK